MATAFDTPVLPLIDPFADLPSQWLEASTRALLEAYSGLGAQAVQSGSARAVETTDRALETTERAAETAARTTRTAARANPRATKRTTRRAASTTPRAANPAARAAAAVVAPTAPVS